MEKRAPPIATAHAIVVVRPDTTRIFFTGSLRARLLVRKIGLTGRGVKSAVQRQSGRAIAAAQRPVASHSANQDTGGVVVRALLGEESAGYLRRTKGPEIVVKIEYLETGSPDCPLIRLYGTDTAEFSALGDVARQLAGSRVRSLSVNDMPGFFPVDECELEMVSSSRDAGVKQVGNARFRWELTPSNWSVVADLIEPFTGDLTREGHQWLCGKEAPFGLGIGAIAVLISSSAEGRW